MFDIQINKLNGKYMDFNHQLKLKPWIILPTKVEELYTSDGFISEFSSPRWIGFTMAFRWAIYPNNWNIEIYEKGYVAL